MKKLFILPLAMMLLASCGGKGDTPANANEWDSEAQTNMRSSIGTVLPYMEFSEMETSFDTNIYQILATGTATEVTAYRALLEVDYNYLSTVVDIYGDDMLIFESKSTSINVRVEMQHYEDDGDNIFYLAAYKYTAWPTAPITTLGTTDVPQYSGENKLTYWPTTFTGETEGETFPGMTIYVFGGSMTSYLSTLATAGFDTEVDSEYSTVYYGISDLTFMVIEDYGNLGCFISVTAI